MDVPTIVVVAPTPRFANPLTRCHPSATHGDDHAAFETQVRIWCGADGRRESTVRDSSHRKVNVYITVRVADFAIQFLPRVDLDYQ
jgi:hypothetical protein